MLGEPAPTPVDLHFQVLGIPVRVHPLFWLMAAILGYGGTGGEPRLMFFWVLAVFVSVLVHEMGHALVIRKYGWQPRITFYGMGGLASYNATRIDPRVHILISLAGPLAGFAFAALIVLVLRAVGQFAEFHFGWPYVVRWQLAGFRNDLLYYFVEDLLFVNIWWGILNLLPIWPLDGGQIARDVFQLSGRPQAVQSSLWLSLIAAVAIALLAAFKRHDNYMAFFFGYMAYQSYEMLQVYSGRGGGFRGPY